jgi:hypothetical protein
MALNVIPALKARSNISFQRGNLRGFRMREPIKSETLLGVKEGVEGTLFCTPLFFYAIKSRTIKEPWFF